MLNWPCTTKFVQTYSKLQELLNLKIVFYVEGRKSHVCLINQSILLLQPVGKIWKKNSHDTSRSGQWIEHGDQISSKNIHNSEKLSELTGKINNSYNYYYFSLKIGVYVQRNEVHSERESTITMINISSLINMGKKRRSCKIAVNFSLILM